MIIRDLIEQRPADSVALLAPGEKLAIVLPNGPEMAAAFLVCANVCTTAPLNPAYREEEFARRRDSSFTDMASACRLPNLRAKNHPVSKL